MKVRHQSAATLEMRENVEYRGDSPILFDYVTANGPDGIQFDVWYGNSHISRLINDHGRENVQCYAVPSRSSYLTVIATNESMDRTTLDVGARQDASSVAKHETFLGEPLGITQRRGGVSADDLKYAIAYPAFLKVPQDEMAEIGRWYEEEHMPFLLDCPDWLMVRRFRIAHSSGNDATHVAIHYLKSLTALKSPQRDAARNTPWRDAIMKDGWFAPEYRVSYPMRLPV
ncbi:hypothetical protein SDC9_81959 [bioreactor metagenome]|uniref:Uncharacterized protein n=1 Tax=bioreactor metagenome TaxID=1076179 RepID=A0A644Z520_9ZZZZ